MLAGYWITGHVRTFSPSSVVIDAVPADHGSAAVDLEAEESQHQHYEGWRHAETNWR